MPCYPPRTPAHPTASGERSDPYWLILVSHGNARLTVHGRKLIVDRSRAGWRQAHIAAAMGISRKCVRTWITRFAAEGEAGLTDRSSRPHTSPRRTAAEVEDRIIDLRSRERRGPAWIGAELGVPPRTVSRVLVRRGQPRLAALDPMTGEVLRASKATAVRYERSRPRSEERRVGKECRSRWSTYH